MENVPLAPEVGSWPSGRGFRVFALVPGLVLSRAPQEGGAQGCRALGQALLSHDVVPFAHTDSDVSTQKWVLSVSCLWRLAWVKIEYQRSTAKRGCDCRHVHLYAVCMHAYIHIYTPTYSIHIHTYIHTCIGTLHTSPTYRHTCIYILYTHTCRHRHEHPTYNTFMLLSYLSNTRSHSLVVYSLSLYLSAFLSLSRSRSFYLYIHTDMIHMYLYIYV